MIWITPSETDHDNAALEKRLWDAADQFRADSGLQSQEYSAPVFGLIFLRFAEVRFGAQRAKLAKASASARHGLRAPRTDNANYLWIQLFHSALNDKGRAGFVMANSASDARSSEQELCHQLIESHAADVMVAVGPNSAYPATFE